MPPCGVCKAYKEEKIPRLWLTINSTGATHRWTAGGKSGRFFQLETAKGQGAVFTKKGFLWSKCLAAADATYKKDPSRTILVSSLPSVWYTYTFYLCYSVPVIQYNVNQWEDENEEIEWLLSSSANKHFIFSFCWPYIYSIYAEVTRGTGADKNWMNNKG